MKTILLYIPCSWGTISTKVFKSILDMAIEPIEGYRVIPFVSSKFPLDVNRNEAIERAKTQYRADYMMFVDADMIFPKDTISKLLAVNSDEFPVVSGVYYKKYKPHNPVVGSYAPWDKTIELRRSSLKDFGFMTDDGRQTLFYTPTKELGDKPYQIDVSGAGCLLVRLDCLEHLKQPYFKYFDGYQTGDHSFGEITEDMKMFSELKKAGIKVLCEPNVKCGHVVENIITGQETEEA